MTGHQVPTSDAFSRSTEANKAANPSPGAASAPPGAGSPPASEGAALAVQGDTSSSPRAICTSPGAAVGTKEGGGVWSRSSLTVSGVRPDKANRFQIDGIKHVNTCPLEIFGVSELD